MSRTAYIQQDEDEESQAHQSHVNLDTGVEVAGWEWFNDTERNIVNKLQFSLKQIRKYLKRSQYLKADYFNHE